MLRITIIETLLFLAPFIVFFVWRWQTSQPTFERVPLAVLSLIGATLAIGTFLLLVFLRGGEAHEGERYVPPKVVDGEVVPGHFVPYDEPEETDEPEADDEDPRP